MKDCGVTLLRTLWTQHFKDLAGKIIERMTGKVLREIQEPMGLYFTDRANNLKATVL